MGLDNGKVGLAANLPANARRWKECFYVASDTNQIWVSDGGDWIEIGAGVGGDFEVLSGLEGDQPPAGPGTGYGYYFAVDGNGGDGALYIWNTATSGWIEFGNGGGGVGNFVTITGIEGAQPPAGPSSGYGYYYATDGNSGAGALYVWDSSSGSWVEYGNGVNVSYVDNRIVRPASELGFFDPVAYEGYLFYALDGDKIWFSDGSDWAALIDTSALPPVASGRHDAYTIGTFQTRVVENLLITDTAWNDLWTSSAQQGRTVQVINQSNVYPARANVTAVFPSILVQIQKADGTVTTDPVHVDRSCMLSRPFDTEHSPSATEHVWSDVATHVYGNFFTIPGCSVQYHDSLIYPSESVVYEGRDRIRVRQFDEFSANAAQMLVVGGHGIFAPDPTYSLALNLSIN